MMCDLAKSEFCEVTVTLTFTLQPFRSNCFACGAETFLPKLKTFCQGVSEMYRFNINWMP